MSDDVETTVLLEKPLQLGEGVTYEAGSDTAWWFDIVGKLLVEHRFSSGETKLHAMPFMASQISYVDAGRQLVASEDGLHLRDISTGRLEKLVDIETDRPGNRSNDGRAHPSGALWIGTMAKDEAKGAGAIYWFRDGEVRRLYGEVSIPNAMCFSPDGATGYFTDTAVNRLMRVPLDPATGLPAGEPAELYDARGEDAGLDGAVVDADGLIWVARWGGARVDAISPSGALVRSVPVPGRQTTCPCFVGREHGRMLVTTAAKGLDAAALAADPQAGKTFVLDFPMRGRPEPRVRIG